VIDVRDLTIGLGIALAIEGALWGAAPGAMRNMMRQVETTPDSALRIAALVLLAVGVGIVWVVRGV
jgi:uncharacterized protein